MVKGLVINRFDDGIAIVGTVTNNKVEGNFIGTDPSGAQDLGNINGVQVVPGADANIIGGEERAARNLVSGNARGLLIGGGGGDTIQGNLIGTNKDGTNTPNNLGNDLEGVDILSSNNTVGNGAGDDDAGANLIAFNGEEGVAIGSGTGTRVLSNSIFSNGLLGIDLSSAGPTPNDKQDPDTGANNLQNFPVLTTATTSGGTTTIKGKLNSRPRKTFTIQFFSNPPPETPEGKKFIGQTTVKTNRKGNRSFTFTPTQAVSSGDAITATATNEATGDTSEFSAPVTVSPAS